MDRSGLFVAPVPGTPPVGTSPTDARLALAGIVGTTAQLVSGGGITLSNSNMQVTVAQAVWQLTDPTNTAAIFVSATDAITFASVTGTTYGDGTTNFIAAAPGTGSRIDSIVVKQMDYANGDADSRVYVRIMPGTPGAPGSAPTPPTGYVRYANLQVSAGQTNAAAGTLTKVLGTAVAPLSLSVPSLTELAAYPTSGLVAGQLATVTEGGATFRWSGSAWVQSTPASFASSSARDTAYAKASGVYKVAGATVFRSDVQWTEQWFAASASQGITTAAWFPVSGSLPKLSIMTTTAQSIATSLTAVTWGGTLSQDVEENITFVKATGLLSVTQTGLYRVTASGVWASSTANKVFSVMKGATQVASSYTVSSGTVCQSFISAVISAIGGTDTLSLSALSTVAGAVGGVGNNYVTHLSIEYVGPAN